MSTFYRGKALNESEIYIQVDDSMMSFGDSVKSL